MSKTSDKTAGSKLTRFIFSLARGHVIAIFLAKFWRPCRNSAGSVAEVGLFFTVSLDGHQRWADGL